LLVLKGNYRADRKEEYYTMRKRKKYNIPGLTLGIAIIRLVEEGKNSKSYPKICVFQNFTRVKIL